MAEGTTRNRGRMRSVVMGAALGLVLGILVSVTAGIPFAPEGGLLLGGLVGWFAAAGLRRSPAAALPQAFRLLSGALTWGIQRGEVTARRHQRIQLAADDASFADVTLGERTSFQHPYLRAGSFTGVRMTGPVVNFRSSYLAYVYVDSSVADGDFSNAILLYGRGAGDAQEGISGVDLRPFRKLTMPVVAPLMSSEWPYCPGIFPFTQKP
jgi:hypothetical protein